MEAKIIAYPGFGHAAFITCDELNGWKAWGLGMTVGDAIDKAVDNGLQQLDAAKNGLVNFKQQEVV